MDVQGRGIKEEGPIVKDYNIAKVGIHSNGRTTNCCHTYGHTTYNRPVSAMVCTINNLKCEHLTIHCDVLMGGV